MAAQFQPSTERDIDTLVPLIRAYYTLDGIDFDEAAVRLGLAELCGAPALGGAWLIREGASAIGYFVLTFGFDLEFGGRQATITELYIVPSQQGQGIGTNALLFVEQTLRALGIGVFELQAEQSNRRALAFYEKFGMRAHARIPLSKKVPGVPSA